MFLHTVGLYIYQISSIFNMLFSKNLVHKILVVSVPNSYGFSLIANFTWCENHQKYVFISWFSSKWLGFALIFSFQLFLYGSNLVYLNRSGYVSKRNAENWKAWRMAATVITYGRTINLIGLYSLKKQVRFHELKTDDNWHVNEPTRDVVSSADSYKVATWIISFS